MPFPKGRTPRHAKNPQRRRCEHPGCTRLGRNKGAYKGKTRYDRFCSLHHKAAGDFSMKVRAEIPNHKCERCGWDKAPCDRHRIDPRRGYFRENIIVLCPNCHREEHHKDV